MADRTSAQLFNTIFTLLAKDGPIDKQKFANKVWEMTGNYDFSPCQLGCDAAIKKLGLARRGVDPEYPMDGMTMLYGPEEK